MSTKDMINKYTRNNPHVLTRPEGHITLKSSHKESFWHLKGNKIIVTQKDVRDTVWRNTAMAKALSEAARA